MPPSPLEWLLAGHLAYFVLEVVEALGETHLERIRSLVSTPVPAPA